MFEILDNQTIKLNIRYYCTFPLEDKNIVRIELNKLEIQFLKEFTDVCSFEYDRVKKENVRIKERNRELEEIRKNKLKLQEQQKKEKLKKLKVDISKKLKEFDKNGYVWYD